MKKIFLALLVPQLLWANSHSRSDEIQKWVDVNPEKGYILSVDLHHEKMCSKIWTKQLREFKKMNPHIKDPNMILVHQKIKVQDCRVEIKEVPQVALEEIKNSYTPLNSDRIYSPETITETVNYKIHITCSGSVYTETYLNLNDFTKASKRIENELLNFYKNV